MAFNLDKDEYVIHEERRSWFTLWRNSVGWLFSILVPIVLFSVLDSLNFVIINGNKDALLMIFVMSWIFIVWNILFVIWTDYYLDILVITNKNLINIEQKGFFSREVAVLSFDKIQDVTTEIHGFVETILAYGDLRIQTAGFHDEFIFHDINRPEFVRSKIKEAMSGEIPTQELELF